MGLVSRMLNYYCVSASVTMFCNTLFEPLSEHARDDVDLLSALPELVRDIRLQMLTQREVLYLRMLDAFVSELTRIADLTIKKAVREGAHADI